MRSFSGFHLRHLEPAACVIWGYKNKTDANWISAMLFLHSNCLSVILAFTQRRLCTSFMPLAPWVYLCVEMANRLSLLITKTSHSSASPGQFGLWTMSQCSTASAHLWRHAVFKLLRGRFPLENYKAFILLPFIFSSSSKWETKWTLDSLLL